MSNITESKTQPQVSKTGKAAYIKLTDTTYINGRKHNGMWIPIYSYGSDQQKNITSYFGLVMNSWTRAVKCQVITPRGIARAKLETENYNRVFLMAIRKGSENTPMCLCELTEFEHTTFHPKDNILIIPVKTDEGTKRTFIDVSRGVALKWIPPSLIITHENIRQKSRRSMSFMLSRSYSKFSAADYI